MEVDPAVAILIQAPDEVLHGVVVRAEPSTGALVEEPGHLVYRDVTRHVFVHPTELSGNLHQSRWEIMRLLDCQLYVHSESPCRS